MKLIGTNTEINIQDEIMSYLPRFYEDSKIINEIVRVDAIELESLYEQITEILNQFFVETATWGLDTWEKELSITIDLTKSYDIRRANILSKIRGNNTFTKLQAEKLAASFSKSGIAWVDVFSSEYYFRTVFNIDDLIDLKNLLSSFEDMKPAHLGQIVGLLITISLGLSETTSIKLSKIVSDMFDYSFSNFIKVIISENQFISTEYNADDINLLYINGSFNLDGLEELDGTNEKGTTLYFEKSEKLTIKKFINNEFIEQYEI